MRRFKIEDHVADIRLYVEGSSLEELFKAALECMSPLIKHNEEQNKPELEHEIRLNANDTTVLLIDFLSEVLTYTQINKAVYKKVEFANISSTYLEAKIFGCYVDGFDEDIKAVTYHEAEIKQNDQGNFETIIVFDI